MTIGASLALIIIGAILSYAVEFDINGLDIRVVGIILMIGGLAGLIIGIARIAAARRRVVPPPGTIREERYYDGTVDYEQPPPRRRQY